MEITKEVASMTVPKKALKTKDGREPFAEKVEKARETLKKHPIPDWFLKK
jgi:hypothetical protein